VGRIAVLPSALADQIAAGEVVERPASVVRELLDNALDAGALRVVVETVGGGVEEVRVTDDGCGMPPDDAVMAFRRHATSKLRTAEELFALSTLGFRGEALPSIASVARVALTTRTRDAEAGTRVEVHGGGAPRSAPAGCAVGTTVEVRDLFYNVPARRKFLRTQGTESAHVLDVVLRVALARPDLHLELRRDGRAARTFLPSRDRAERARDALEEDVLLPIEGVREGVEVEALLAPPARARNGAAALHLFVNGRPVRDRQLARAVAFAYGDALPPGRFPLGVVHLTVDPAEVDVNVHPQKAEVRLGRAREVAAALTRVLAAGLGTSPFGHALPRTPSYWRERLPAGPTPRADRVPEPRPYAFAGRAPSPPTFAADRIAVATAACAAPAPRDVEAAGGAGAAAHLDGPPHARSAPPRPTGAPTPAPALPPTPAPPPAPAPLDAGAPHAPVAGPRLHDGPAPRLRFLAALGRAYLLCESADALVVVAASRADARVRYASLRRALTGEGAPPEIQRLLFPERVELTSQEVARLGAAAPHLERLGFDLAALGPATIAVRAVPALLARASPRDLLRDALEALDAPRGGAGPDAAAAALDRAVAAMARRAAVRTGAPLTDGEATALVEALGRTCDVEASGGGLEGIAWRISFDELGRRLGDGR
jgi:DNA mismatch repair protein MutL